MFNTFAQKNLDMTQRGRAIASICVQGIDGGTPHQTKRLPLWA